MGQFKPLNKYQEMVLRSNADFVAVTGAMGNGKTFVSSWIPARNIYYGIGKGCGYIRRNEDNFVEEGGYFSCFRDLYKLREKGKDKAMKNPEGAIGTLITSEGAGAHFDNGYVCKFKGVYSNDQKKLEQLFKGIQSDMYIFDETEDMTWDVITYANTRVRGRAEGNLRRRMYMIQNPERECFLRELCGTGSNGGGWIDDDGEVIEEMNGKVRYFFCYEGVLANTVWGDTKEEVYEKSKHIIDNVLEDIRAKQVKAGVKSVIQWTDFIKSFVFYDLPVMHQESSYAGNLAMSSAAQSGLRANWNYSKQDARENSVKGRELSGLDVTKMFRPKQVGSRLIKRFMTVDYAATPNAKDDIRSDNLAMFAWEFTNNGLYCFDEHHVPRPDPTQAKAAIRNFRDMHGFSDKDIVYDAQGPGGALYDDFKKARWYDSKTKVSNRGRDSYVDHKAEDSAMAVKLIKNGMLTINAELQNRAYYHTRLKKTKRSFGGQLIFEAKGVLFTEASKNKLAYIDKKVMKSEHLSGFSQDLFDNIYLAVRHCIYDLYRMLSDRGLHKGVQQQDDSEVDYNDPYNVQRAVPQNYAIQREQKVKVKKINMLRGW